MKVILLLMGLTLCNFSFGQDIKTVKIDNLEVMTEDLDGEMTWDDAKQACASLGVGWRLPTKAELNILYQNKDTLGGFASNEYWSCTEYDISSSWRLNFSAGSEVYGLKRYTFSVRAVRATVNKTVEIGNWADGSYCFYKAEADGEKEKTVTIYKSGNSVYGEITWFDSYGVSLTFSGNISGDYLYVETQTVYDQTGADVEVYDDIFTIRDGFFYDFQFYKRKPYEFKNCD